MNEPQTNSPSEPSPRDPAPPAARPGHDLVSLAAGFSEKVARLRNQVAQVIVGQDAVIEEILIALLAGGHAVLEGVPGLAKTLLVSTLARALSLDSGRIQFTPDLMPSDVTGTQVITENPRTRERQLTFRRGPVFVNLLLADEINRTPPKTQAALLEAMSEGTVTAHGTRFPLPRPFCVLATQNPIEQEGTYRLPEAQLDRFLLKIVMDYPSLDEERLIVDWTTGTRSAEVEPVLSRSEILGLQHVVRALHVPQHLVDFAARLVRATRPGEPGAPAWAADWISWGAGPRAAQALLLAAKARTLIEGRFAVSRTAIRQVALPALRHRVVPSFRAEAEGHGPDDIVRRVLAEASIYRPEGTPDPATRKLLGI